MTLRVRRLCHGLYCLVVLLLSAILLSACRGAPGPGASAAPALGAAPATLASGIAVNAHRPRSRGRAPPP